jgi:hypothetical protein
VIRTLIAGAEVSNVQYAEDYEIDTLKGPEPLLITDADSSQHSAVVDVLRSQSSQVIQGPPGTGKSQTITNIIAAALNEGLTVLFVAEKMAALEVVKKRLDDAGLKAFCLELHSNKISKASVTDSLNQRLEYRAPRLPSDQTRSNAEALTRAKADLLYYVQHVNDDAGKTGLKVYDVLLGSAVRDELRHSLPTTIADARFGNALNTSTHSYRQMSDAAGTLEAQMHVLAVFGNLAQHPWRGFQNIELTELDETRLVSLFKEWNRTIFFILEDVKATSGRAGVSVPATLLELQSFCKAVMTAPPIPSNFSAQTFCRCSTKLSREQARGALELFTALIESEKALLLHVNDTTAALSVGNKALAAAVVALRDAGVEQFTVASVIELKAESQREADLLASMAGFCGTLTELAGLTQDSIKSLRAAVAAIDLLNRLPRPLWSKRLTSVLDEANRSVLERGASQATALGRRREALDAEFDLQLLPNGDQLRTHGLALRSANGFTALLSPSCRNARRIYRGIVRNPQQKRRRIEMATGLLGCGQYLADVDTLLANSTLRSICGTWFEGLNTPFAELMELSTWAIDVRQRLAAFGETGLSMHNFLFSATLAQLDRLHAAAQHNAFASITTILGKTATDEPLTWTQLVQRHSDRAATIAQAVDVLTAAGFKESCNKQDIHAALKALEKAEKSTERLAKDAQGLSLVGGSVAFLRQGYDDMLTAVAFAETIAQLDLPQGIAEHFFQNPNNISVMCAGANDLLQKYSATRTAHEAVNAIAQLDPLLWCGAESFDSTPLQPLLERNERALDHIAALRDYVSFLQAEDAAIDQGIGPVLSVYSVAGEDYCNLQKAVEFVFYRSAAEAILNNDPRLRRHSGATHQELRNQFRTLDKEYLELKRKQLAINLTGRSVPQGNSYGPVAQLTELALVTRVAGQTKPRVMVRDLMNRAGKAIQALMPCWMMSPMSVAQYLDPRSLRFDLVIMDEASQIRPQEALGGIARTTKAVIVGDQMQLPPTPFFQKLSLGETTEDEEFAEETKQDSVLEAAAGRFYPSRRLRWHYRSEHESLIAFSNREFYQNGLTVFPSPFFDHPDYGVSFVPTGGVYKASLNEIEGNAVVKAAVEFMKSHPKESLGVVAVNAKQADFIREQLDKHVADDAEAAAYVQAWNGSLEEHFVKNLENVQGDERDAIFISTVYGKDENGNFHQRFGPINGVYGHRRLNVLFTRAKKKITVFTSMSPEDIQEEGKQPGVGVLKRYLQYARDGIVAQVNATGAECESEFESWVLQVLQAHGYEGVPQVGVSGFRIDIAVRHPVNPGVFLCGIECDGATYHSARSVRERDRLRQEILERYKWKLYRIWSTDWFRNPSLQTKLLLRYLEQLHPPVPRT